MLKLQKNLSRIADGEEIEFVTGKGKKKLEIQQIYEELEECGRRLMKYKAISETSRKMKISGVSITALRKRYIKNSCFMRSAGISINIIGSFMMRSKNLKEKLTRKQLREKFVSGNKNKAPLRPKTGRQ